MTNLFDSDIFNLAPIAMWIEDFSGVKALFDQWRDDGVTDIRAFLREDRDRVIACSTRSGCSTSTQRRSNCSRPTISSI